MISSDREGGGDGGGGGRVDMTRRKEGKRRMLREKGHSKKEKPTRNLFKTCRFTDFANSATSCLKALTPTAAAAAQSHRHKNLKRYVWLMQMQASKACIHMPVSDAIRLASTLSAPNDKRTDKMVCYLPPNDKRTFFFFLPSISYLSAHAFPHPRPQE